jgi:hypothetical protein
MIKSLKKTSLHKKKSIYVYTLGKNTTLVNSWALDWFLVVLLTEWI